MGFLLGFDAELPQLSRQALRTPLGLFLGLVFRKAGCMERTELPVILKTNDLLLLAA